MSNAAEQLAQRLQKRRTPDGGFAATLGWAANTESTALAGSVLGPHGENGRAAQA